MNLAEAVGVLRAGKTIGKAGARAVMDEMVSGTASEDHMKDFLLAWNDRGPDALEIAGFAEGMRAAAVTVEVDRSPLVDTCGTGGDGLNTINISTAAAFVVCGAGVAVAKHGNRSVSSKSGSADVLEALGVIVDRDPQETKTAVEEKGFGFFFAPRCHPAMKHVGPVRKAMGVRTVFNLLGPLANPAGVKRQVVGVFDETVLDAYAHTMLELGCERALVVRGEEGMDEFSLAGPTVVRLAEKGDVKMFMVAPEDAGLTRAPVESLKGGDAEENARHMVDLLSGKAGPMLDAVLMNAGGALWAAGVVDGIEAGVEEARRSVSSGKAMGALEAAKG